MTISPWYRYTLNSSTYTAIDGINITGAGNISVAYFTEDGSSFMVANVEAGTNAYTVPEGASISEVVNISSGTAFYAKSVVGSPVLVVKLGSAV